MSVEEFAGLAGCSENHVRDMLRRSDLKGVKLGKIWRINRRYAYALLGISSREA